MAAVTRASAAASAAPIPAQSSVAVLVGDVNHISDVCTPRRHTVYR